MLAASEVAALLAPRLVQRSSLRHLCLQSPRSHPWARSWKVLLVALPEGELSASTAGSAKSAGVKAAGCVLIGLPRFTAPPLPASQGTHCTDLNKVRSARLHAESLRIVRLLIKPFAVPARCSSVTSLRPSQMARVHVVSPLCARTPGRIPRWSGTGILIMLASPKGTISLRYSSP